MNKIILSCVTLISLFTMAACNKTNEFSGSSGGYNQEVFSIVSSRCYECHANGNSEGGFNYIDDVDLMVASSQINPANPSESKMYKKIMGTDTGAKMPWGGPYLNKQQSDAVLAWIGSVGTVDPGETGECETPKNPATSATWAQVKGILESKCIDCHQTGGAADGKWLMGRTSTDVADHAQMKITNSTNCSSTGACSPYDGAMVIDGFPCQSRLYRRATNKVYPLNGLVPSISDEVNSWRKMPPNPNNYFSDSEAAIVYKWIEDGASN
jgi:uncharacterized membrane protein